MPFTLSHGKDSKLGRQVQFCAHSAPKFPMGQANTKNNNNKKTKQYNNKQMCSGFGLPYRALHVSQVSPVYPSSHSHSPTVKLHIPFTQDRVQSARQDKIKRNSTSYSSHSLHNNWSSVIWFSATPCRFAGSAQVPTIPLLLNRDGSHLRRQEQWRGLSLRVLQRYMMKP